MKYDKIGLKNEKCYACDRPLGKAKIVETIDHQTVYVGPDCYQHVATAGELGYQPPLGGPRLLLITLSHNAD